jgi:hypothetical protein
MLLTQGRCEPQQEPCNAGQALALFANPMEMQRTVVYFLTL